MKYLAVILALIIGTPSIADAGELDGKPIECKKGEDKRYFQFYSFENNTVFRPFIHPVDPRSISREEMSRYYVDPSIISWHEKLPHRPTSFRLSRETLVLDTHSEMKKSLGIPDYAYSLQCKLTNKRNIQQYFERKFQNTRERMKKNKL